MKPIRRISFLILAMVAIPGTLLACLWDYDTLKQERARFPSTLELITGKFLRHSPEFYQWRIEDRIRKLKSDHKNLGFHDDLGVAYDKTAQHDKAIETMLAKDKIQPGLYETYANLGTFLIHKGEFKKGIEFIDKAMVLNPDAHFGREKYQKLLVEYILTQFPDGKVKLPVQIQSGKPKNRLEINFLIFLGDKSGTNSEAKKIEELPKAIKGVLGMMRFSKHDSPILLEVLGDLLSGLRSPENNAKQLAARAFLQASYLSKDQAEKTHYRDLAKEALHFQTISPDSQTQLDLGALELDFQKELGEANRWYQELKTREIGWISQGANPELEFDLLYTQEPGIESATDSFDPTLYGSIRQFLRVNFIGILVGAGFLLTVFGWLKLRHLRKSH